MAELYALQVKSFVFVQHNSKARPAQQAVTRFQLSGTSVQDLLNQALHFKLSSLQPLIC